MMLMFFSWQYKEFKKNHAGGKYYDLSKMSKEEKEEHEL
jgi:hypothetical protein